jgi:DNA-binding PadR family transcriptional regulator
VLELAVLGLLKDQDLHGYELKKRLSALLGMETAVSFGSLYPALAKLETAGAVEVVTPASDTAGRSGAAPGAVAGRRRKVYRITTSGVRLFDQLLADGPGATGDERSFSVRLAFARYLPTDGRLGLLQRRRALVAERLSQLATRAKQPLRDRYVQLLAEHEHDSLSRDLAWLDRLIREEQGASRPAGQVGGAIGLGVPLASTSQLRRRLAPKTLAPAGK